MKYLKYYNNKGRLKNAKLGNLLRILIPNFFINNFFFLFNYYFKLIKYILFHFFLSFFSAFEESEGAIFFRSSFIILECFLIRSSFIILEC